MTTADPHELLCERCGYPIGAIPGSGACPECGEPVHNSLPARRTGSPWQRRQAPGPWLATLVAPFLAPARHARTLRIETRHSRELRSINLAVAALLHTAAPIAVLGLHARDGEGVLARPPAAASLADGFVRYAAPTAALLLLWLCARLALSLLTATESRGIRLFGRVHRARITPEVAAAITGHATTGWVLGGVLATCGTWFGLALHQRAMLENVGTLRAPLMLAPIWMPALGAFVGLLSFEVLVYIGVRRCRFANPERPRSPEGGAPPDPAQHGDHAMPAGDSPA